MRLRALSGWAHGGGAQVLIRGFMAADDAGPAMDAAAAQLAQPPPGQAAAGASRLSVRADPLDARARQ
jgi:hypothetical protein